MTDHAGCAVLGCDDTNAIQGVSIPGLGWIRLCAEHIIGLKKECPIAEIDINIQK